MKAQVSGGLWEAQERWRLKSRICGEASEALAKLRRPFDLWPEIGSYNIPEDAWKKGSEAVAMLRAPAELAALWIRDEETVKRLRSVGASMDFIFEQGGSDIDTGESVCKLVDEVRTRLLESARVELRLGIEPR